MIKTGLLVTDTDAYISRTFSPCNYEPQSKMNKALRLVTTSIFQKCTVLFYPTGNSIKPVIIVINVDFPIPDVPVPTIIMFYYLFKTYFSVYDSNPVITPFTRLRPKSLIIYSYIFVRNDHT